MVAVTGFLICLQMLQTVRIWQESENGNYNCVHTLKDHTAEVSIRWPGLHLNFTFSPFLEE